MTEPLEHTPWPTPSRAIYGFVLYILTYVIFAFYLLWALLPDQWLHAIGLTYLPARHWVITFPFLICLGVFLGLCLFILQHWLDTPAVDDLSTLSDEYQQILPDDIDEVDSPAGCIPPLGDLSLNRISKLHQQ